MRVFSRDLGKYCTVVSTKQLKEAQAADIPEAKITVELHVNIHEQKTKPFFRRIGTAEVKYGELKF